VVDPAACDPGYKTGWGKRLSLLDISLVTFTLKPMSIRITVILVLIILSAVGIRAQVLTPKDFEIKMNESKDRLLIDVRTQDEYRQGHLPNALLLDYYSRDFNDQLSKLDKSKPVFVYCASGGRSNAAARVMKDMGFKQVFDLQGGFRAWSQAQKPIVK
jgi:rhodanese-related sulfurtransferase